MNESFPTPPPVETEAEIAEKNRNEYAALAQEVSESHESFDFPGMDSEAYQKAKATDEEYPEYVKTTIDELLKRFEGGCKVVFGIRDKSTVYLVPTSGNDDPEDNSLFPAQLAITDNMNEDLRKLVLAHKTRVALYGR